MFRFICFTFPYESISFDHGNALRCAASAAAAASAFAHDIPCDVTVQAFVKPAGDRLHLLVRVPLEAMRDVDVPDERDGYLDLDKLAPMMPDAAHAVDLRTSSALYEDDDPLPRPGRRDANLAAFRQVVRIVRTGAGARQRRRRSRTTSNAVWNQMMFDVLFDYPIHSDRAEFSIDPAVDGLAARVNTVLRFLPPGGAVRAYEFSGDPGLVRLDPSWYQAALCFIRMGFDHILDGTDHLLFLLCLVIPFRRFRALIPVVTAFTVAHSITLIASAYGLAPDVGWFPPLIETLIAVSIVYMALENIVGGATVHRRWMMAFGFGLVHGFGFSFALRQSLQFAGAHMLASLLSFNIGVELGQLLVLRVC